MRDENWMSYFRVECPSHTFKIEMTFWIDLVEDGVKYRMKSVRLSDFLTDLTHFSTHFNSRADSFYPYLNEILPLEYWICMEFIYRNYYGVYKYQYLNWAYIDSPRPESTSESRLPVLYVPMWPLDGGNFSFSL